MHDNFEMENLLPREVHAGKQYPICHRKILGGCLLAVFAAVFTLFTVGAVSGEIQPYGETAFKAATSGGKTVVLDFHADWCPVCRKQGPLLESLAQEDKLKNVVVLKVDYDEERALKKQLKILSQSTLVVFKGEKEVARATGVTDKDQIRELIEKGL